MAEFDPFASGLADPVQAPASNKEAFDPFSSGQAEELTESPKSSAAKDFFQRLGQDLWKGLGGMVTGLDRLEQRLSPATYDANQRRRQEAGLAPVDLGASIASVADVGLRTDPARDQGLPALASSMIGSVAPTFLLGPLAPVGLGAQISDQERQRALAEGESPEVSQARGDLGFSAGAIAGLIPVPGKNIATKALTGAAGNVLGDVVIEGAQGRTPDAKQALTSAGVGALFGAGVGVQQKLASPKPAPAKPSFSIVSAMDAEVAGNPSLANSNANAIAMRPIEPTAQPKAAEAPVTPEAAPPPEAPAGTRPVAIEMTAAKVDKMTPEEFMTHYTKPENAITNDAVAFGESTTDKTVIDDLLKSRDKLRSEVESLIKDQKFDEANGLSYKAQWFNEAYESATKTGGFAKGAFTGETPLANEGLIKTFETEWKEQGGKGGSENQVIIKDGTVIKRNYNHKLGQAMPNFDGNLDNFETSVRLHNELFPSTRMEIIGSSETSDGPAPVISQSEINGKQATGKEVRDMMAAKGFESAGGANYFNPETGVRVEDLRTANVLKDAQGNLHVIDSVIRQQEPVAIPQETSRAYIDELLATKEITPEEHAQQIAALPQQANALSAAPQSDLVVRNAQPVQTPKAIEPLVSTPDVQKFADDMEVADITGEVGTPIVPPPPPTPPNAYSPAPGSPSYRPGLTSIGLGIGKVAEGLKILAGTIEGNIRDANKRIFGVLRNYEHAKSQLSLQFETMTMPASRLARKILTPAGNDKIGNLLMSGKVDEAKALVAKDTRYGEQFAKTIDDVRAALDYAHSLNAEARDTDVPYLKDYFPRQMIDYAKFREFLGKGELDVADAAIRRAQMASSDPTKPLTKEQIENVLNNLISQSRMNGGKPGYLKSRTIKEIDDNISRFYEPWDVALENHLRKVTNDVINRSYFGKAADGAQWNPEAGDFGKVLAEEKGSGSLKGKALTIVIDNLQDRFRMEQDVSGWAAEIGRKIRFAQSAAYLGQVQTAVAQFGDIFGSILHQGPIDTAKGYTNRRFSLRDIGIHEGNVETSQFSRNKGLVDKAADLTIKFGVGLSDQFNKGGVANAIQRHYASVVKKGGVDLDNLSRDYSAKFPEKWPQMLKELKSPEFQRGEVSGLPEAQFFLYNEMADIHPINPSGMAQGFNAAHPLSKPMWGLKSYMIKQLDIMRARGYEKIKDPKTRGEGFAYLAAYAAIVAAGQNFAISWMRDKLADRESDTSDYFVGGFLQPLGISRYTITQLKQGEVGKAMVETALPIVSLAREGINDAGVFRDWLINRRDKKTRQKTVPTLAEVVNQSELVKHFPVLGSIYYSRAGKGADKEKERRLKKAKGQGQPNTVETISDMFAPEETSSR